MFKTFKKRLMGLGSSSKYNVVADYFISLSNETGSLISNLKLQKLVYYAQAWHLAKLKESIFDEDFEAWVHGPVLPGLYVTYKELLWKPILRDDLGEGSWGKIHEQFSPKTNEVLDNVVDEYFILDAYQLEKLTHNEDPWRHARTGLKNDEPSHNKIAKSDMADYYSQFLK